MWARFEYEFQHYPIWLYPCTKTFTSSGIGLIKSFTVSPIITARVAPAYFFAATRARVYAVIMSEIHLRKSKLVLHLLAIERNMYGNVLLVVFRPLVVFTHDSRKPLPSAIA